MGAASAPVRDSEIRSIEAIPVAVPLSSPIKWARGEISVMDNVLIVVTLGDGTRGIADAPSRPTILGDTQASLVAIVREHFAPRLEGTDVFDMQAIWAVLDGYAGNAAAKAAIDMACHDAQGRLLGCSCAQLLGARPRPLPVNWRLKLGSDAEMLADASGAIARHGFRALKVKGGVDPARDVRFLRALRREVGEAIDISVDFNQGYSAEALLRVLPVLEEVDVSLIEEPIPARDGEGKRLVAGRTRIPISGDDSCLTPEDVLHEFRLGAIRALVIKVARNGYVRGRDIVALARAFNIPAHNGTQADLHLGSAAAAHFACAYRAQHPHELSTFLEAAGHFCDRDLEIRDGHLVVPDGAGIGIDLDEKRLARYRIDK